MDYRKLRTKGADLILEGVRNFALADIVDSGQCFRWNRLDDHRFRGVALGRVLDVAQRGDSLILYGVDKKEFSSVWFDYFDFGRDYGKVKAALCADPTMGRAVDFTPGMRVLRQDPWETLISFILSANNNIPRIKGIVERLCELLGAPLGEGCCSFPGPERLAVLSPEDLAPLRCGYRARYLIGAAKQVAGGEIVLEELYHLPIDEARVRLRAVCGVGAKVAECVLLYGFGRAECVPVDVWINRALENLYPGGMPDELAAVAGLGQQYLFHYVRHCPGALDPAVN